MLSAKLRLAATLCLSILCSDQACKAAGSPANAIFAGQHQPGSPDKGYSNRLLKDDDDGEEAVALLILIAAICGTLIGIGFLFAFFLVCSRLARYIRSCIFGIDEDGVSERLRSQLLSDEDSRQSYELARAFERQYPYGSINTQLTPVQETEIREKGVGAWEFVVSLDVNAMLQSKTEVLFMGGENCVQTNLPIPKANSVYYFEVKLVEKPAGVNMWIGLATKPYPTWRMTGWNKYSVGYSANNGNMHQNSPFKGMQIGEQLFVGDILGIGYQPRSGLVWFTRNGRRYKAISSGMLFDLFPTISADGPCSFSANFGQRGFVFIEANVKRWGFAPIEGTSAPPPIYGANQNTILLETAADSLSQNSGEGSGGGDAYETSGDTSSTDDGAGNDDDDNAALGMRDGIGHQEATSSVTITIDAEGRNIQIPVQSSRGSHRRQGHRLRPPHYQKDDPIAAQLLEAGSTSLEPVFSYRNKQADSPGSPSTSLGAGTTSS